MYTVGVRSEEVALDFDDAVIAPVFFFLRLILCPDSSSEDEYTEESVSSLAGDGVAGRFLKLDLAERFLKITGSAAARV